MRRHVQIADDSGKSISITFWGDELCGRNDFALGAVLAIKAAKTSEFGGRSLNCSSDSSSIYKASELKKEKRAAEVQYWAKQLIQQSMGDIEQAFLGYECLTVKPQSRAEQGMRDLERKEKQSNLNVS